MVVTGTIIEPSIPLARTESKIPIGDQSSCETSVCANLAQIHGLNLLELWECERAMWPEQLADWQASIDLR